MEHSCFLGCFWDANMLDWPAPPSTVLVLGEMRSNGLFLFFRFFMTCEHARLARTSQHRFWCWGRCGQMEHSCFPGSSCRANMLDWPAPPSTVLVRACFWSVRRRG